MTLFSVCNWVCDGQFTGEKKNDRQLCCDDNDTCELIAIFVFVEFDFVCKYGNKMRELGYRLDVLVIGFMLG